MPDWKWTRPGMAMHNWSAHVPGVTIVPPDPIEWQLAFYSIRSVDTKNQILTVDAFLRTMWTDPRLAFTPASEGGCLNNPWSTNGELGFDGVPDNDIWTPGVSIMNSDEPEKVIYSAYWVYPSGYVWWAKKIEWKMKCQFDFSKMPYDKQTCPIRLVGWRDVDYDISFAFYQQEPGVLVLNGEGADIEWTPTNITGAPADPADSGFNWGGQGLEWTVAFERVPGYYEKYYILPLHMIIMFVYMGFYISRYAVPARTGICIVGLLVLFTQSNNITSSLPRSNSSVWLLSLIVMGQGFVLVAMVQFAVVNMLTRIEARIKKAQNDQASRDARKRPGTTMNGSPPVGAFQRQANHANEMRDMGEDDSPCDAKLETVEQITVQVSSSTTHVDSPVPEADAEALEGFGNLGRLLYNPKRGNMFIRDEHADIFCRYVYLPAYAIAVGVLNLQK